MKAYRVVFAPEAVDQLEALYRYVAEHASAAIASRFTDAIVAACESLALFPLRGVARVDIRPGLRLTHHDRLQPPRSRQRDVTLAGRSRLLLNHHIRLDMRFQCLAASLVRQRTHRYIECRSQPA